MNCKKVVWAAAIVLAAAIIGGAAMFWFLPRTTRWKISEGEKPAANPLKGWACWAEDFPGKEDYALAYVPVYWSDVEPDCGVYDFRALEETYHFEKWKKKGTRLVLRVVADSPSDESTMDIPSWLCDAMDGDGVWYDNEYGKGFSPNYENPVFKNAHAALLKALGQRYNENPQVAYVQLGSLGHWGEWHVNQESGIPGFPDSTVTDRYVRDYLEAFPDKKLLMRRPYAIVAEEGIGLYDDTFGESKEHREWMSWISDGYISDQNGQALPGAPGFWKKAPSGGEIAGYHDISWYFEEHFADTLSFIRESHTTYLGPHIPKEDELSPKGWENAEICRQEMGYCLTVREASLKRQRRKDDELAVRWENIGLAPFYEDWDIRVRLKDNTGKTVWSADFPTNLSAWPQKYEFTAVLEGTRDLPTRDLTLWIGLVDPLTDTCRVKLAVAAEECGGMYCMGG